MATGEWPISGKLAAGPNGSAVASVGDPQAAEILGRLKGLHRRGNGLVLVRGWALVTLVLVATFLIWGFADYGWRSRDPSYRWISSLSALVAVGGAVYRWLVLAWRGRTTERQLIRRVEERFPELKNRLASAVDFALAPDDPRYGSVSLRQHVVRQVASRMEGLPLHGLLDWRPAVWSVGGLMAICSLSVLMITIDRESALLSMRRLCLPWHAAEWPRKHHLTFVNAPPRLAQGQDFRAEVVDHNGRLPSEVRIEYRWLDDPAADIRRYAMVFAGGRMTHRLAGVTRSFEYRAAGGDDEAMAWRTMEVVTPPRITAARMILSPPAYTGLPVSVSSRRIRALAGTTVSAEISTSQPLRAATLVFQSGTNTRRIRARVADGGRKASLPAEPNAPWVLSTSGTYAWELVDDRGVVVVVERDSEIEVIPDLPPVVTLQSPAVDAAFTPRAVVPLQLLVRDDLATHQVELRWPSGRKILFEQPAPAKGPTDKTPLGSPGISLGSSPAEIQVEHAWDLAEQADLKPGMKLSFELVARDFQPQEAAPVLGSIRLLTDAEFEQRIQERQEALWKLLREAVQLQRSVQVGTSTLAAQVKGRQVLAETESAAWPNLTLNQRRVEGLIAGEEGALRMVEQLLADLAANRWEAPQWSTHCESVRRELSRIAAELLPKILTELVAAERALRFGRPELAKAERAWNAASQRQLEVIQILETLIGQMSEWDRYRNLAQEVRQALDAHQAIREESQALGTAGREFDQLTPDEQSKLRGLSQRLQELANQIDRFQSRLEQLREQLANSNPEAEKTVGEALEVLEKNPISGGVRDTARDVGENRLGAATRRFDTTHRALESLLAAVSEQEKTDAATWARQLPTLVANWIARQDQLRQDTITAREDPTSTESAKRRQASERLRETQQGLQQEIRERSESAPADSSLPLVLELIGAPMAQAAERLAQTQLDAETERLQGEALNLLRELAATLEPKPATPPSQPAEPPGEQPDSPDAARTPSLAELKLMRIAQLELLRRTGALEDRRPADGPLPETDERELRGLQAQQERLSEWLETFLTPPPEGPEGPPATPPSSSTTPAATPPVPGPPVPATQSPMSHHRTGRSPVRLVAWLQPPSSPPPAAPTKKGNLDRQLLDDLPPARRPAGNAAGEDVGGAAEEHPLEQLRRQCREAHERLRQGDTALRTQQLQRSVAAKLATMIQEAEDQQAPNNASPQNSSPMNGDSQKPNDSKPTGQQPGSGHGSGDLDPEKLSKWARGAWGVLPDRVRAQIQDLGDEQFLPEYEQLIRDYFNRLAE